MALPKAVLFETIIIKDRTTARAEGRKIAEIEMEGRGQKGGAEGKKRGRGREEKKGEAQAIPAPSGSTEVDPIFSAC